MWYWSQYMTQKLMSFIMLCPSSHLNLITANRVHLEMYRMKYFVHFSPVFKKKRQAQMKTPTVTDWIIYCQTCLAMKRTTVITLVTFWKINFVCSNQKATWTYHLCVCVSMWISISKLLQFSLYQSLNTWVHLNACFIIRCLYWFHLFINNSFHVTLISLLSINKHLLAAEHIITLFWLWQKTHHAERAPVLILRHDNKDARDEPDGLQFTQMPNGLSQN